jgi:5-methylthioadenosine/S-adenosylhomocysteine deaminase
VEFPDFETSFAAAREWLAEREPGLALRMSICPHSTYLLTERQLRRVAALGAEFDALVQVHAAENAREVEAVAARHGGLRPIEVLQTTGLLSGHIVLAHAVELSETDLDLIAARSERTRGVAHCPVSNMKLASGVAPIPALRSLGVPVGLGTDGPASSNDLDLFAAMRVGGLLHSLTSGPGAIDARDLVTMATIGGARTLGIEHWVGSLEPGKYADLVIMDGSSPLSVGADPYSALVYAMGRAEVRTVLVDGAVRVADGQPIGVDGAALHDELTALIGRYPR